jgi:hypothetical protein
MSFQISFDGVASAELTHLLQGVERQLNWQGIRAEAAGETAASSVASGMDQFAATSHGPCPDTKAPDNPNCIHTLEQHAFHKGVGIGFGVGLIAGIIIATIFIKRMNRPAAVR